MMQADRSETAAHRAAWQANDTAVLLDLLERTISEGRLNLPVLPGAASELLALTTEPEVEAAPLIALLHRDPALAAHTMRVANSAAYAAHASVRTLQQAVTRIGAKTLGEMALAATLRSGVFHVPGHEDVLRAIWREAAASGVYAREIARRRGVSSESAFLSGFLQPIGKPVVLQEAVRLAARAGFMLPSADALAIVEHLHARAGHALGEAWGLPAPVVAALAARAWEDAAHWGEDVAAADLAAALARRLLGDDEDDVAARHPAWESLALTADDAALLLERDDVILAVVDALAP
jgi:HD-like signal output (HDOD) protein